MTSHPPPPNETSLPATREGGGHRVLVVEDEPDGAESLRLLISLYGHTAAVARDGPTALTLAEQFRPHVVLLDIGLPGGMDGLEVARRIREQAGERPPLLVAVTGRRQADDRRRCGEAGIHLHLLKPADPEVIRILLDSYAGGDR